MSTTFQKKIPLFCHILINLTLAGLISACSPSPDSNPATIAANDQTYNTGWKFFRSDITLDLATALQQQNWQDVQIPHTPKIEPLIVNEQFQGDAWYKK